MHLHTHIYLYFIAIVLVVSLTSGALFNLSARSAFQTEVSERLWPHLASLVGESFHDRAALTLRVRQLHDDLDVDMTVRDRAGSVLAAAGEELPPVTAEEMKKIESGEVIRLSRPALLVKLLIRDPRSGQRLGILEASAHQRSRFFGLPQPLLTWTLAWLIVALATRPLARHISHPLERLTEAARRIGRGDFTWRASAPRRRNSAWWKPAQWQADELQQLSLAFDQMTERIDALLRGQRQLLANISHEIRSPLARIRVALELLPCREIAEDRLRAVETDLAELDRLVEDVLTATRLDATGLPANLEDIDVREFLAQIAEQVAHDPLVAGRAVEVAEGEPLHLIADPALLKRALWNLIENAAKYGSGRIILAAADTGADVSLSVSDEGPGIPPAERERVLMPFYRLEAARTPARTGGGRTGAGLGLTLVALVARVHGGAVTIGAGRMDGGREIGCRVTMTIPKGMCA